MGKPVDLKKLEMEFKRETDPNKKRKLDKEIKMEKRDQIKRLKDFESGIKSNKATIPMLEKTIKKETDRDLSKKMMVMLDKHVKDLKAQEKKEAAAAKRPGGAAEDPKAALQRLKKFERDVDTNKRPENLKKFEKTVAQEKDKKTKVKMMQKLKKSVAKFRQK